jgi:6,7-dimethyl-8-ribityllumazine synthase
MMPSTRYDADAGSAGAPIEGARIHTGGLDATGMRFGIVVSRFNSIISTRLLDAAVEALRDHGVGGGDIEVVWVPGAFEIPIAARELAQLGGVDAVVCLGAVIRGDTPHFDYVAGEASRGVASVHATTGVPATFGVLTCDTVEQARDRSGGTFGNKGIEAAVAAIEMASLLRELHASRTEADHLAAS